MTNGTSQGLFIVVAIIIFGIFTLTSYVLFKDNLKPTLANIFTNGFNQSTTALNNGIILENNINTDETNSTIYKNQLYVKIRDKNESKNESEVWVLLEELKDDTYAIKASGIDNTSPTYNIQGYSGSPSMTGELTLPNTINGKKITLIKENAFAYSRFTGSLKLPDSLQSIGDKAFYISKFSGELILPDKLTSIGTTAFIGSNFSGSLTLPDSLKSIGFYAFENSKFTGSLTLSDSLQSIGEGAFTYSKFSGSLTLPDSLQSIGSNALNQSVFDGQLAISKSSKLESIGENAFGCSKFTGNLVLPDSLQSIGAYAFNQSNFSGSLTLPDSLQSIGAYALYLSKFSGTLDISNVTNIGRYAFGNSSISTIKNDSLNNKNKNKTINENAIKMSDGSYYSIN